LEAAVRPDVKLVEAAMTTLVAAAAGMVAIIPCPSSMYLSSLLLIA
jgi:hypothetical protein